jgi:hypothetical protein
VTLLDIGSTGVSGTRSRYRRISEIFGAARTVLYVVNLAEYDIDDEGGGGNQLLARLAAFAAFVDSDEYPHAMICVVLSHRDDFSEKLATSPLRHAGAERGRRPAAPRFLDFEGKTIFDAIAYIQGLFVAAAARGAARRRAPPVQTFAVDLMSSAEVEVMGRAIAARLLKWNMKVRALLDQQDAEYKKMRAIIESSAGLRRD